jgi:predicted MPP superfamily phosphohydrolase
MKKIIHLSDLHFGYKHCTDKLKKIVKKIINNHDADSHVVVVTGDLVDNANRKPAFKNVWEELEKLEKQGFLVLVVPGNHDYGSGSHVNK